MTSVVVFGAGGRAGRRLTAEARSRGFAVTAVVRDPARYPDLEDAVAGDVTSADLVESAAKGHDVAISAVYTADLDPQALYGDGTRELLAGLERAGVARLLVIGLATTLEGEDGKRLFEAGDFPEAYVPFSLGRAAELDVLRDYDGPVDWVVFTPPMEFVDAGSTGRYQMKSLGGPLTYGDMAIAVLDEVASPRHHRAQLAVSG
jgi:putative NADH-flavin reductase